MKPGIGSSIPLFLLIIISILIGCSTTEKGAEPEKKEQDLPAGRPQKEGAYETIERLIKEGDTKQAAVEFEKIKKDDAESVIAYAGILMSSGDYSEAESALSGLLEREPQNADALYNLALVKGLQADPDAEIEYLDKAIAADGNHSGALSIRGMQYLSDSKLKKASELFERALASDPENIIALTGYGSVLIRQEEYEKAGEYLDRAVALDPANPFTYLDRSNVRAANGDMKGAESDLSSAIELEPDYFWHYLDRGRLRIRDLNDKKGALEDFDRAIELNPDIFYTYVFRAGIYDDMDELEAAAADYERIIRMKPDYYFAYSSLGIIRFLLEDWDGCRKAFEAAFEYEPEEYVYPAMAAVAVLKKGDAAETRKYVKKTMDKIPVKNIYYQILRSYIETSYDAYALRLIQEEEDKTLQTRLLFYIAELYHQNGMKTAAYSYFSLLREKSDLGLWESRIAGHELEKYYE